jgi:hypothetical protein
MTDASIDDGSRHPEAPQPDEGDQPPPADGPTLEPDAHPEAPQPLPDDGPAST